VTILSLKIRARRIKQSVILTSGCDLIVMASHGRSGIAAVVLGSVTAKVLTHTSIPTLVI